jgi:hypothetical protein
MAHPTRSPTANAERCLDEPAIIFNRELDYEHAVNELDLALQVGLWHDLEFHLILPIIFSDQRTLTFATGDGGRDVSQDNSAVDPSDEVVAADLADGGLFSSYRLFSVDEVGSGPSRSGVGNMTFGLAWSPYNAERTPHLATVTLGFDYVAPTGDFAARTNDAAGNGVHELRFSVAASRRFPIVDPYIRVEYALPLLSSDSLFVNHGGGQVNEGPGQRASTTAGAEFVLYEHVPREQLFTFDVGFDFAFQAEGRDYSPLFDALGASECNGTTPADANFQLDGRLYEPPAATDPDAAACAWILQQPSNQRTNPAASAEDQRYFSDGITHVEAYATLGLHVGLNFQISKYVEVRVHSTFATETEHFLTSERTGRDKDGDDEVDFNNPNERNPVYNPALDGVGQRFRVESVFNASWWATLAFQF